MNQVVPFNPQQQPLAQSFTMSDMERVALAIAKGGLFGSSDPNAVLTLCMLAQAEGQHPAVVFRDYHIISGKPAKKAEAMQRDFLAAGGKIEWHKLDDQECEATFSHPQGGSATISWDKKRVEQAELGSNKMHKKYPRQMLRSRVISEGVRTVFPMATSGLYEVGEVQDIVPQQDTPATPQPKRARDLKAEKAEQAEPTLIPHDAETGEVIESTTEPSRDEASEDWVNKYIAKVKKCPDTEALMALQERWADNLAALKDARPDLHELTVNAGSKRAAELQSEGVEG